MRRRRCPRQSQCSKAIRSHITLRCKLHTALRFASRSHNAHRTLVLQAIPTSKSDQSPALEAARVCLGICRDLRGSFASNEYLWAGYCHWFVLPRYSDDHQQPVDTMYRVILHNPLTPFTVVFGNVITNHEAALDDLQLLEDYCVSLQPARRISEGVEKWVRT